MERMIWPYCMLVFDQEQKCIFLRRDKATGRSAKARDLFDRDFQVEVIYLIRGRSAKVDDTGDPSDNYHKTEQESMLIGVPRDSTTRIAGG